ncbi:MAG: type IV toxin-antitoxin system AbiEi family antitoxin domain-containing protein [Proteobacteria bacterium]|nr:type IV toxin-antitoxin system AbiEi family antitoxin domain-containing protein [Pseudomonadota bacterium]
MRVAQHIRHKLEGIPLGQPFTSKELIGLGEESNIRKVLERLVKEEEIIRVTRGIYVRPKISRYVGRVPPSLEAVLETISTSTGEVFQVHGAEAVRQLGLSTQVPVKPLFLTNGRSRILSIGNIEVKLRKVSQRKLILAGTLAGIAVSALWYLTKEEISLKTIERIEQVLPAEEFEKLTAVKASLPSWVTLLITNYQQQMKNKNTNEKPSNKLF